MNPDGTPIVAPAPAAAPVQAVPATPAPAAPAAPAPQPGFEPRGVEGAPHPGVMTIPGQAADTTAAVAQPAPAAPAATPAPAAAALTPEQLALQTQGTPATLRAQLAALGLSGVDQFADDNSALQAVAAQAQAAAVLQQQLQAVLAQQQQQAQYAQQQAALQQLLAQQRPAAAAPAAIDPYQAPEYQQVWEQLVVRDDKGVITGVVPGVPGDMLGKYHAYHAWRKNFADKLLTDPRGTLAPLVAAQAQEQAKALVQQELAKHQTAVFVNDFVQQNSNWLHMQDGQGQVVRNPANGQPLLSPLGQRFKGHLEAAHGMGVTDIRQQERYAREMLRADVQGQQFAQQQAAAAAQQTAVGANRRPSQTGTLPAPGVQQTVPQNGGISLHDQLMQAFHQAGINDQTLAAGMG